MVHVSISRQFSELYSMKMLYKFGTVGHTHCVYNTEEKSLSLTKIKIQCIRLVYTKYIIDMYRIYTKHVYIKNDKRWFKIPYMNWRLMIKSKLLDKLVCGELKLKWGLSKIYGGPISSQLYNTHMFLISTTYDLNTRL